MPPAAAALLLAAALVLLLTADPSQGTVAVPAREASQFLRTRQRRANQIFEETKQGHLERECVEERCSREEAREVFENDPETEYFYDRYLACIEQYGSPYARNPGLITCVHNLPNQCTPNPCHKEGSTFCEDKKGDFYCQCKEGWTGKKCETDIDECWVKNGGCNQICVNKPGSFHCSCYSGYALQASNRICEDINECKMSPAICGTAHCRNLVSSYSCHCDTGYKYNGLAKACEDVNECEQKLCEQVCVNSPGSYTCHCDGRGGVKLSSDMNTCEDIMPCVSFATEKSIKSLYLGRMFSGTPVIWRRFRRKQPTRLVAEFDFRTFDPEGVLFFAGGHRDSTWIVLALRNGRLELQLKYNGIGRVTSSGPLINHGMWQTISVEELERSLVIKVNRDAVMKIAVSGDLFTFEKGLYQLNLTVGGIPFRNNELIHAINSRLDGCMRGWNWLNGEDSTTQETVRLHDKMQCYAVAGRGSFFPGKGFAFFNIGYMTNTSGQEQVESNWTIEMTAEIRPAADTGVLFALVSDDKTVPLSLSLIDYHFSTKTKQQLILLAVENVIVSSLEVNVCDNDHSVGIFVNKEEILLTVDGIPGLSTLNHTQLEWSLNLLNDHLQKDVKTCLGGLPDALGVVYSNYADDTQRLFQLTGDVSEDSATINKVYCAIHAWMAANHLALNDGKTELLVLGTAPHLKKLSAHYSELTIADTEVTSTPVTAFYHGCMTVKMNKKALDLDEAVYKHGDITSHSCPPVETGK